MNSIKKGLNRAAKIAASLILAMFQSGDANSEAAEAASGTGAFTGSPRNVPESIAPEEKSQAERESDLFKEKIIRTNEEIFALHQAQAARALMERSELPENVILLMDQHQHKVLGGRVKNDLGDLWLKLMQGGELDESELERQERQLLTAELDTSLFGGLGGVKIAEKENCYSKSPEMQNLGHFTSRIIEERARGQRAMPLPRFTGR